MYTYFRTPDSRIIHMHRPTTLTDCEGLTNKEGAALYRAQAISDLRDMLPPGSTVRCVLRHVSSSGMTRRISLFVVAGGSLQSLDYLAALVLGDKQHKDGGIVVSGCGMDMGFHLVYNLGRVLYPEGFDLPPGTRGRNGDTSGRDSDGGYAFRSSWV